MFLVTRSHDLIQNRQCILQNAVLQIAVLSENAIGGDVEGQPGAAPQIAVRSFTVNRLAALNKDFFCLASEIEDNAASKEERDVMPVRRACNGAEPPKTLLCITRRLRQIGASEELLQRAQLKSK